MLSKCPKCQGYTLSESCSECKSKTESAHYKFPHLRDAPRDDEFWENPAKKIQKENKTPQ